jgi:hypothetical protein
MVCSPDEQNASRRLIDPRVADGGLDAEKLSLLGR